MISTSCFDFLGFTHYWGKSRRGNPVIKRKTEKGRLVRSLKQISQWCRQNRHRPIEEQSKVLSWKLRGHFNYYGITGNSYSLSGFYYETKKIWRKWLDRRSQKARMNWDKFNRLLSPCVRIDVASNEN